MNTRKTKPWLHFKEHEPVPAHFIHEPKRKTVKTARILMLFLGEIGMQRFYLDENAAGWRWIFGLFFGPLFIYIALALLAFKFPRFEHFIQTPSLMLAAFLMFIYSPFLIWIVVEWRSLPRRVEAWNAKHIGER